MVVYSYVSRGVNTLLGILNRHSMSKFCVSLIVCEVRLVFNNYDRCESGVNSIVFGVRVGFYQVLFVIKCDLKLIEMPL